MSHTVIDSKTQKVKFGVWPLKEDVTTTLTLLNLGKGDFGINYNSKFSGIKGGHVNGGPIQVDGNISKVVHKSPEVKVIVSNFSKTSNHIAMHVKITVAVLGSQTIYDQTLGGAYSQSTGWETTLANLDKALDERKELETSPN